MGSGMRLEVSFIYILRDWDFEMTRLTFGAGLCPYRVSNHRCWRWMEGCQWRQSNFRLARDEVHPMATVSAFRLDTLWVERLNLNYGLMWCKTEWPVISSCDSFSTITGRGRPLMVSCARFASRVCSVYVKLLMLVCYSGSRQNCASSEATLEYRAGDERNQFQGLELGCLRCPRCVLT